MEKLKELREAKNMTQSQLGEYIGAKKSAISLWEAGERQPDQETLMRLASYFSVSVDYLLGHESPDQIEKAPTQDDARAEAKMLLENMTDDEYERALAMLKLLNGGK